MNKHLLKRISLVATAALVASGAAMAQSQGSTVNGGGTSNAAGAINGSAGTSGATPPALPPSDMNGAPAAPSVDYNRVDPTAAGVDSGASKPHKARHTGSKKGKHARDAASAPSVLEDPNRAGGGSGNSNVR